MKISHFLRTFLTSSFLMIAAVSFAALDIVPRKAGGDDIDLVLKDMDSGKVLGNFWNRDKGTSDYSFESSKAPIFHWNEDRSFVAVDCGNPRSTAVCLYRVAGNSLKEVEMPGLSAEQAAPIDAIKDVNASGTEVVNWQPDGTLLVRHSAFGRAKNDTDPAPEANVWATIKIAGNKASILAATTVNPEAAPEAPAAEADAGLDAKRLVGVHQSVGKNPNGSSYRGTVKITVNDNVVSLEWKIGDSVSHGKGVLVGNLLGVALDSGLSLYTIVDQADGMSLVGLWSGAGSTAVNSDTILIGNPDITSLDLPTANISGKYISLREVDDGQIEANVQITGKGAAKKVSWDNGKKKAPCQAIAHSDGLAILTPEGLAVYQRTEDNSGSPHFTGALLTAKGKRLTQTLTSTGE